MKKPTGRSLIVFVVYMALMMYIFKQNNQEFLIFLSCTIAGLFLFSILVRRNIHFKPYFTSKYNLLTSKIRHQKEFDLPKDILFDKMMEVLSEAGFKVRHADKAAGILFATSSISMFSWGENIYVDMTARNGRTNVDFCSACFFGVTSWGRNEKNYEQLLDTFENSLII